MNANKTDLEFLCNSKNGRQVVYDPIHSHATTHFNDAPQLKDVVIEIISAKELHNEKYEFDTDMGRIIGNKDVVNVHETDELLYAKRKNRDEFVPFVKNRNPQPTSLVSMGLVLQEDESYLLTSAWFGEFESPPFPGEAIATPESVPFWNKHAFVWGSQGVQDDTVTSICPW